MKQLLLYFATIYSFNLTAQFTNITPMDLVESDFCGFFIDINGDDLLVSAAISEALSNVPGALYHYRHDGSEWVLNQKILPELPEDSNSNSFGNWFSLSDDWFATTIMTNDNSESVVFYKKENDDWVRHSKITSEQLDVEFGWQVAVHGNVAVIGAIADFNDEGLNTGVAYVYEYDGITDSWNEVQKLSPTELDVSDFFGSDIYMNEELIAISARRDSDNGTDSGAVYVFEKVQNVWTQTAKLLPEDSSAGDYIGYRLSGDGERLIVSGYGADNETGSVYVFRNENGWTQEARLIGDDLAEGDWFGSSIAIEGDRAIVGSRNHIGKDGAVFVFEHDNGNWNQTKKFEAPDVTALARFGAGLAYENEKLVVGAPWAANLQGAIFALDFNDLTALEETKAETIVAYPNPCQDQLFLNIEGNEINHLEIQSIDGSSIFAVDYDGSPVDISRLSAGTYLIKTKSNNAQVIEKFIKI